MKKIFLTFVVAVMLSASLTACTASPSGSGNGTGTGGSGGGTTQGSSANSRARNCGSGSSNGGSTSGSGAGATHGASGSNGSTMHWAGRYYADENGDVFGGNDGIGNDIRRATDDMMDNMGNAVNDMTH